MSKQRFKLISAVNLLLFADNKILLARRFQTNYEDGKYSVIAGHLDGKETAREAMCREALEEANILIKPSDLKMVLVMHRNAEDERVDFFFTTDVWGGQPQIAEPDKCDDLSWFELNQLPQNIIPYVLAAIRNFQDGSHYAEFGWD